MPIQINAPDGTIAQFPDGTPDATITKVMAQNFPPPKATQSSDTLGLYQGANKIIDNATSATNWALNKIPVGGGKGLGDAIDSAGQAMGFPSIPAAKQSHADYIAQQAKQGVTPSARGRIAGEIGATLPTLMLPGGPLVQGAVAGGLSTDSTDPAGIAKDAALGAAAGKVGEYGGQLLSKALKSVPVAATTQAIKDAASKAYQTVDNSGMIVSGNAMRDLTQGIQNDLTQKGVDATLHPKAIAAFNRIASDATNPATNGNVTFQGLDTLRKVAGQAAMSSDPADRYMGKAIQGHIDSFVDNLNPSQLVGASDPAAIDALGQARSLWKTQAKSQIIDAALNKAENSSANLTQGGSENAQRTAFRQLANNPSTFAKFNPDEQQAILNVVRGGPVSNAMRQIGKLAPRGVVSAGMDMAMGAATGIGGIPLMAAGEIGRLGSAAVTNKAAQTASALVRNGGKVMPMRPTYASKLVDMVKTPTQIAAPVAAVSVANQGGY